MQEEGTVEAIEEGRAHVRVTPGPQCGGCCACSKVGSATLLDVAAPDSLSVGDRVRVEIATGNAAVSALLLFALPLLGLVAGVILGSAWKPFGTGGDADGLLLGALFLVVLLGFAVLVDHVLIRPRLPEPRILEVIGKGA